MFVLFARSSSTEPFALPKFEIVIDQVIPPLLGEGVPIVPPVVLKNGSVKLLALTFVTGSLNVARNVTLVAFVF